MGKTHKIVLCFVNGNKETTISCECGEKCGTVVTGTKVPEIMTIYRKHIQEEENA